MKRAFWGLVIVNILACNGLSPVDAHPDLVIDPTLDVNAVMQALDDWETATNGGFSPKSITISDEGMNIYGVEKFARESRIGKAGYDDDGNAKLMVKRSYSDHYFVVLHEFGHWLGFGIQHVGTHPNDFGHEKEGLMSPEGGNCIDKYTVERVCSWLNCGPAAGSNCMFNERKTK